MLRQRLIRYSILGTCGAVFAASLIDIHIGCTDGVSYLFWLLGRTGSEPHVLAGLRDGLFGNIIFFVLAGFATAIATARNAKDEAFVQRLLAMFPKLEQNADLIRPIMSLVKEDASITQEAKLIIRLLNYDPATCSYVLGVTKQESIVSLLELEKYEDEDFRIRVNSDVVPEVEQLGRIIEASISIVPFDSIPEGQSVALRPEPIKSTNFLGDSPPMLTPQNPTWRKDELRIEIPPKHRADFALKYEITSIVGTPFTSMIVRPTRRIQIEFHSMLQLQSTVTTASTTKALIRLSGTDGQEERSIRSDQSTPADPVNYYPSGSRPEITILLDAPVEVNTND